MQLPSLNPAFIKPATTVRPQGLRRWRKRIVIAVLMVGVIALGIETSRVLFFGNFHEVLPGHSYRSAQLSPEKLRNVIRKHGIRTVINLRGCCSTFDWYQNEGRVTHELNVAMEDLTFSATRLPAHSEIRRLVEVLDHCEYPILFHCRQGADRTSLAAAVVLLLHSNADVATAKQHLSPRYSHLPILATREMDRFFDMYEDWLRDTQQTHTPDHFRAWVANVYKPDPAPARLELVDPKMTGSVGKPLTLKLRATNLSNAVWQLKPGTAAGVHARYILFDPQGNVLGLYRAGRFEATVAPGEMIVLELPLPPFHQAGLYRLNIDLADRHLNFGQLGSEWLDVVVSVE